MTNTTYSTAINALDALSSGKDDNPAQAIAEGQDLSDTHILEAELQHDTRKALRKHGLATPNEVVASKKRKVKVTSENATAVGPVWAQQMQQQMQQMQQNQEQMQQQMQQMQQNQEQMQQQMQQNQEQMQQQLQQTQQQMLQQIPRMLRIDRIQVGNASSQGNTMSTISLLPRVSDGLYPKEHNAELWVPLTWEELAGASLEQVTSLLEFYELPTTGNTAGRRSRLLSHLCGH